MSQNIDDRREDSPLWTPAAESERSSAVQVNYAPRDAESNLTSAIAVTIEKVTQTSSDPRGDAGADGAGSNGNFMIKENGDSVEENMEMMFQESEMEFQDTETEEDRKSRERREKKEEKKRKEEERERERTDCLEWWKQFNSYGQRYEAPIPKFLVIRDVGKRKFSREDIMKKTCWLGRALDIKNRADLPTMKIVKIMGEQCVSIHCENPDIVTKMMTLNKFGPCDVRVEKDEMKNTVVGVIYDHDNKLMDVGEEGVKELLTNQGVTKVIQMKKGREKIPLKSYKLIFDRLICPDGVDINRKWFQVREFIPPPLRCFHCQKYEHAIRGCRNADKSPTCQRCGGDHKHLEFNREGTLVRSCSRNAKCVNCKGGHEAGARDCPKQMLWQEVQEKKVLQKLTHYEAKQRVFGSISSTETIAQSVTAEDRANRVVENENKTAIQQLHTKFDKVLEEFAGARISVDRPQENIEARVQTAVNQAVQSLRAEMDQQKTEGDRRHNRLQQQVDEATKTIKDLTTKNQNLQKEAQDLRKQLKAANVEKEQLQDLRRQLDAANAEKEQLQNDLAWAGTPVSNVANKQKVEQNHTEKPAKKVASETNSLLNRTSSQNSINTKSTTQKTSSAKSISQNSTTSNTSRQKQDSRHGKVPESQHKGHRQPLKDPPRHGGN